MKRCLAWVMLLLAMGAVIPTAMAQTPAGGDSVRSAAQTTIEYTLPPEKLEKARAIYHIELLYALGVTLYGLLLTYLVLRWKLAARWRDVAEKVTGSRVRQGLLVIPFFVALMFVAEMPWRIYIHTVSVQYGFSVQSWGGWVLDRLKDFGGEIFISTLLGSILYATMRRSPRRWWLYFWFASIPIILFTLLIKPMVIDPMYNKFTPLEQVNPQLVAQLEKVVQRGGLTIPEERMFEMKASEKTTLINAYVTGLGASKRVVVWDTAIQKLSTQEIMLVFGHEMGHYVLGHVLRGTAMGIMGTLFLFLLLKIVSEFAAARWGERWGIRELSDWASVPLISLVLTLLMVGGTPIGNYFSRQMEHDADIYGVEVTHGLIADEKQVAAHSFQVLGENGLDYPYVGRTVEFLLWTHPAIRDRVRFVQEYDPWSEGRATKFVK